MKKLLFVTTLTACSVLGSSAVFAKKVASIKQSVPTVKTSETKERVKRHTQYTVQ